MCLVNKTFWKWLPQHELQNLYHWQTGRGQAPYPTSKHGIQSKLDARLSNPSQTYPHPTEIQKKKEKVKLISNSNSSLRIII